MYTKEKLKPHLDANSLSFMEERLQSVEERLNKIEKRFAKKDEDAKVVAIRGSNSPNLWAFVHAKEVNDDLVNSLLALYIGKNFMGFREFLLSQLPFAVYLLGNGNDVCSPLAAIIVRTTEHGHQLKLSIHSSRTLVSVVAGKYVELLRQECDTFYCELGSSSLETIVRSCVDNVKDVEVVSHVANVPKSRIIVDEDDGRRAFHSTGDGSPAPLGSFLTLTNKRLALFGPRLTRQESKRGPSVASN